MIIIDCASKVMSVGEFLRRKFMFYVFVALQTFVSRCKVHMSYIRRLNLKIMMYFDIITIHNLSYQRSKNLELSCLTNLFDGCISIINPRYFDH